MLGLGLGLVPVGTMLSFGNVRLSASCHLLQCLLEVGSAPAERTEQGEVSKFRC